MFTITPFNTEKVGQIGDKGIIENEKEIISILEIKVENNIFLHIAGNLPQSTEKVFIATVDKFRRKSIEKNHSVTHLLHYALSIILSNVFQNRADICPDNLKFYFSYTKKLTNYQIKNIEGLIQEMIFQDFPLLENISLDDSLSQCSKENKKNIRFGPIVRLCNGLHVKRTGEIGIFKIISENYYVPGFRRIEAITAKIAINYLNSMQEKYNRIIEETKIYSNQPKYIGFLQQNYRLYINKFEAIILKNIKHYKIDWLFNIKYYNNYVFINEITFLDIKTIKAFALELRKKNLHKELLIIINSFYDTFICISISDNLINIYDLNACKIIKKVSTNIHSEMNNKGLAITKSKKNCSLTEHLKIINNCNEIDLYFIHKSLNLTRDI